MASFSLWSMFWQASHLIQLIIFGLFLASIWSWALIFYKGSQIYTCFKKVRQFERLFWNENHLYALRHTTHRHKDGVLSSIFSACMLEWDQANNTMSLSSQQKIDSFRERIDRIMSSKSGEFSQTMGDRLLFLATLGSTAPFIGLFGTVLGIMNSFHAIAANQDASLVSVAPGIAEALFTTALGLAVAIPAIVAYNVFSRYIAYFLERIDIFCDDFTVLLLRQLHERTE